METRSNDSISMASPLRKQTRAVYLRPGSNSASTNNISNIKRTFRVLKYDSGNRSMVFQNLKIPSLPSSPLAGQKRPLPKQEIVEINFCEICQEDIGQTFGLLENCAHPFCGSCIVNHAETTNLGSDGDGSFACPVCSLKSTRVIISNKWLTSSIEKRAMFELQVRSVKLFSLRQVNLTEPETPQVIEIVKEAEEENGMDMIHDDPDEFRAKITNTEQDDKEPETVQLMVSSNGENGNISITGQEETVEKELPISKGHDHDIDIETEITTAKHAKNGPENIQLIVDQKEFDNMQTSTTDKEETKGDKNESLENNQELNEPEFSDDESGEFQICINEPESVDIENDKVEESYDEYDESYESMDLNEAGESKGVNCTIQ